MKQEIWRNVEGYENYQVSNLGNVKSLNYRNTGTEQILKPRDDTHGYLIVALFKKGKGKNFKIHRLVAKAFLANPENFGDVNHKNEIKTDNRVENLEWCTRQYNLNYGTHNERVAKTLGIPVVQLTKTGEYVATYQSAKYLKRNFNFNDTRINQCCRGIRKTHKGYSWQFLSDYIKQKAS